MLVTISTLLTILAIIMLVALAATTVGLAVWYIIWVICKKITGWDDGWR